MRRITLPNALAHSSKQASHRLPPPPYKKKHVVVVLEIFCPCFGGVVSSIAACRWSRTLQKNNVLVACRRYSQGISKTTATIAWNHQPTMSKQISSDFPPMKSSMKKMNRMRKTSEDPIIYQYSPYTFSFLNKPELNELFNDYLQTKKITPSIMKGMFIYNCIAFPGFIYKDVYLNTVLFDGVYGRFGQLFLCAVFLVHGLFFTFYRIEYAVLDKMTDNNSAINRKFYLNLRTMVLNAYVILSLCATGIVM